MKDINDSSSEEQQDSSDEEMDWSSNNSLFANLSIPQLDGAADENSGGFYYGQCRGLLEAFIFH